QASKNAIIYNEISDFAYEKGFPFFNFFICYENDNHLTYIHLCIMASILLNANHDEIVYTVCFTGQVSLISINIHPGFISGKCNDPP
ncbi:hypothetical protein ACQWHL_25165, partial [Salmonella enterica subsp. enterica serovar Infantis]